MALRSMGSSSGSGCSAMSLFRARCWTCTLRLGCWILRSECSTRCQRERERERWCRVELHGYWV
uniref:Uncharacterized protein n=1 Tax=Arundo donax TaxID=35708 RepID=A0A0A8XNV3_ARUDO